MIDFDQAGREYNNNARLMVKATVLAVLRELESKPHIVINRETLANFDYHDLWPMASRGDTILGAFLSYKDVSLHISISINCFGTTITFPTIMEHKKWLAPDESYTVWTAQVARKALTTQAYCRTNTEDLYKEIVDGYKRYEAKSKKIAASNNRVNKELNAAIEDLRKQGSKVIT